jgi:hypothetical protein
MKNLTLSADEALIERAREAARRRGRSLNDLVRGYLEELAGEAPLDAELERLRELSEQPQGHRRGWRFDRDELHDRT